MGCLNGTVLTEVRVFTHKKSKYNRVANIKGKKTRIIKKVIKFNE